MSEVRELDWRSARIAALGFLAIKLVLMAVSRPFMDETYYFLWGQHPALSYFDHPPLVGWTEGLAGALFGWTILGLRFLVLLTLIGDLVLLWLLARRLKDENWREAFWPTTAIFLATPIFFALSNVALPDHLLVFFSLATVYGVERVSTSSAPRWLYFTGLAIGLATLSKYTGALLGVGLVLAVVFSSRLRPLLKSPHLYLAALLAIVLQGPVLVWNIQHNFASFGFIVGGRAALGEGAGLSGLGGFLLGALAVLSPFLIWSMARFVLTRGDGHGVSRWIFWLSTLGFLAASAVTNILIHWNAVAYVAILPFLFLTFRSRVLFWLQMAYGLLAVGIAGLNYAVLPFMALISYADQTSAWSYGWEDVAARVAEIRITEQVDFVAATDYSLASPLAFALTDRDVTSLSPGRDAFDDWFDAAAHAGQTALIVADNWRPLPDAVKAEFGNISEAGSVDVVLYGRGIDHYTIYLARGFSPDGHAGG